MPEATVDSTASSTESPRPNAGHLKKGSANAASGLNRLIRKKVLEDLRAENDALRQSEADRLRMESERDQDGGSVTSERMRRVLAQMPEADCGPTDSRLREWLSKDVKGYLAAANDKERVEKGDAELKARIATLEAENTKLVAAQAQAVVEEKSEVARDLILRCLSEAVK